MPPKRFRKATTVARIEVHTHIAEEGRILIDIDDDGPGISEDKRALVFDPYFTTRREGTGLGLAIVKKIIVEHGGMITCEASPLGAHAFELVFHRRKAKRPALLSPKPDTRKRPRRARRELRASRI